MRVVNVRLGRRSYRIRIVRGGPEGVATELVKNLGERDVAVLTDRNVGPLYAEPVLGSLRRVGCRAEAHVFRPGESAKSPTTACKAWEWLLERGFDRKAVVLALGGGVVGDLAGFVASTWNRGVDLVQVPTTLLAQVDSSVGGKTGFNLGGVKNVVGTFHQPALVFASLSSLGTLATRDFRAGLAEVVKHGVIARPAILEAVAERGSSLLERTPALLEDLVADCCEVKRDVVQADEREAGPRQVLNFGHTVGHAIESATRHRLRHGEAVSLGMIAACRVSEWLGECGPEVREELTRVLEKVGLPVDDRGYWTPEVAAAMRADKKRRGATINVVVVRAVGDVAVRPVDAAELTRFVGGGAPA